MAKVKTESIYVEKTPKQDVATPIADMFRKVRNYKNPLLSNELLRKRKRVRSKRL